MLNTTLTAVVVVISSTTAAQTTQRPDKWSTMLAAVRSGETLVVELDDHTVLRGPFVAGDAGEIVIWTEATRRTITRDDVTRVRVIQEQRNPSAAWVGAVAGAAAGFVTWREKDGGSGGRLVLTRVGSGIGYWFGGLVSHRTHERLVYTDVP